MVIGSENEIPAIIRVNPFVDLPEVAHDAYVNPDLSNARGGYEIAIHTNNRHVYWAQVATHLSNLSTGAIASLSVPERNISTMGQIVGRTIHIDRNAMTEDLEIVK